MRFIYWSITALIALVMVVFAVSNRATVMLALFPLPAALEAPLYLVVLVTLILGFIVGVLVTWIGAGKRRAETRNLRRRIERLQHDINKTLPAER